MQIYRYPAQKHRTELVIDRSRFITCVARAQTTQEARQFITDIHHEMPDANHHVYAFCVGYGKSVIEGMSDDGEPSGTAGPPSLAVLRGSNIGDIILVTTRYFGGIKLGTGGLVRAYTESAQQALQNLPLEFNIPKVRLLVELDYAILGVVERYLQSIQAEILDKSFTTQVEILVSILEGQEKSLKDTLRDLSAGRIHITQMD